MKASPKNTMISQDDEIIKNKNQSQPTVIKKAGSKWFFPATQEVVEAESLEEAIKIINNKKENK